MSRKLQIFFLLFLVTAVFCNSFPLSTQSRWIIDDATGRRVKLACLNYASHLPPMIPKGLNRQPVSYIAEQIILTGFNCVRFTWPTFLFTRPDYGNLTVSQSLDKFGLKEAKAGVAKNNPQFLNMVLMDVHQAVVNELGRKGVMVVLDNHISHPQWCCFEGDRNGFFGDPDFDPHEWLKGLHTVARTYKGNPAVIAMSIRNELRGNRQNVDDWYKYMQQGALVVSRENPDVLIIVSGLSYDTNLDFIRTSPFNASIGHKLVFEAHSYSLGTPVEQWVSQTNQVCARVMQNAEKNYFFLFKGETPFPLFMSEFGMDESGKNEADNKFISCFLTAMVNNDLEWALWSIHGSYMFKDGQADAVELSGILDFNWDRPRNPSFIERMNNVALIYQDASDKPVYYKMYHSLSGRCVVIGPSGAFLDNCKSASRWEQHQDGGPIKLVGQPLCLTAAGAGAAAQLSYDCTCNESKWRIGSISGLHLAAQNKDGSYLCLEKDADSFAVVTKTCLCIHTPKLDDFPSCEDNPQLQWFKLVPANV